MRSGPRDHSPGGQYVGFILSSGGFPRTHLKLQ